MSGSDSTTVPATFVSAAIARFAALTEARGEQDAAP
jgi:hypothetical protein